MQTLNQKLSRAITLLLFIFSFGVLQIAMANTVDEPLLHPAIPLLDEEGNHVRDSGKPYSPKVTCGSSSCHDYDAITHAYHFEMGRDEARDDFGSKRGLPHLVSPGYFGGYTCMGGNNPEVLAKKHNASADDFADKGSAGLIKRCIGCHTGGGWMEKDRNGRQYYNTDPASVTEFDGDYFNRGTDENNQDTDVSVVSQWNWNKSGVVEADCMMCHTDFSAMKKFDPQLGANDGSDNTDSAYNHFRDLRNDYLVKEGGYFRYAATAILEFLNLKHPDGSQEEKSLLIFEREIKPANGHGSSGGPDYTLTLGNDELPVINWNADAFDSDGKVLIPMLRFPANDNCMLCHRTSNSRRGFYGFGEVASATYEDGDDGPLEEDYKDDVHKGKTWTEPNGETRAIENCNACHSRNYFKKSFENVDLNADHNFLKGNSDMDVRNDLDYNANAKTCEYCHNDAPAPAELAIPSGHEDMLSAHREIWKSNGDMAGYPINTLTKITQTHLNVIACQTCHITNKKDRRGNAIQILYRYRAEAGGELKIVPYNPRLRYYWKDRNSGRVLNKTERNSVFELKEENGEQYGAVVDSDGNELTRVSVRMSHGSVRFGDPEGYEGFVALKNAYDSLFMDRGVSNPDAVLVRTESNAYIISHNARPSPSSLQCGECHNRKQSGAFSSLVSTNGLFGENNTKTVVQLPDRRLVDEGIIVFDLPYMQMDETGKVTESVADILYVTKIDPSMTALRSATAPVAAGVLKRMSLADGLDAAGLDSSNDNVTTHFTSDEIYLYKANYGNSAVRAVALIPEVNGQTELVFPSYRMQVALADNHVASAAENAELGELSSRVFSLEAIDKNSHEVTRFSGSRVMVKLPYEGTATNINEIKVIFSNTGSTTWQAINNDDIVIVQPHSDEEGVESEGYVAFLTDHFSHYAIVNNTPSITPPSQNNGTPDANSSSGGGGSTSYILLLLLGLVCVCIAWFTKNKPTFRSKVPKI